MSRRKMRADTARPGQRVEFFHESRHWDGVIFEILSVEPSGDVIAKVVGYSKRHRYTTDPAHLGKRLRLSLYTHDLYTTYSFGDWYKTHGGNDGKAAVL